MKYYFIAGEASGDLHGSNLIRVLKQKDPAFNGRGFGGELMQNQGMSLVKHYRNMAYMGFIPVLLHICDIKKNFQLCEQDLLKFHPDVLILIDYPGFNLKMAKFAHKHNIRVFYYISPKIWAWKTYRIKAIKKYVDEMFTILPFETDFYKKYDYQVHYVGNPTFDEIEEILTNKTFKQFTDENQLSEKPIIALLPGSRLQEIHTLLPKMIKAATHFSNYQIVIAAAPNINNEEYNLITHDYNIKMIYGKTYEVLQQSKIAFLASGTVSLEAAIIGCPQIVCYKMAGGRPFSFIARSILKIKWVSLVNLILNHESVKELLQEDFTVKNLLNETKKILEIKKYREKILAEYKELRNQLGKSGSAKKAAEMMICILNMEIKK
ncbi:MAG: lipid-A-disaccharide synthase [Prolixibacteraceae bacterium]|nr:lipid-A-disaccharide synthase [Prolixibacteraceae bacterium]